jgi:glutathione S-transferase
MITLYQFQFSHFCEKARWALEHKGLPYVCKNLLPGLHIKVARNMAPKSCVPILVDDDGTAVQDSTKIITYLDGKFPQRPLTPRDPRQAEEALQWEEYLDEEIGVPLRLWFYYHTLPDRSRALRFLLDGSPWYGRPLLALIFSRVRPKMMQMMNIHAESARQSHERLLMALGRLDGALKDRNFLVGNSFSRADLTACALLAPFCAPGKSEAEVSAAFPAPVYALRNANRARPFFRWVVQTYRDYRRPPEETSAAMAPSARAPA